MYYTLKYFSYRNKNIKNPYREVELELDELELKYIEKNKETKKN